MHKRFYAAILVASFLPLLWSADSTAALYPGNGNTSYGGAIGNGSLNFTDNGTWMSATFNKGGGSGISFHGELVIFIDCAPGGYNTTSQFAEHSSVLEQAVSGLSQDGRSRSVANFAPGFYADYAIAVGVNSGGAIYKINQTDSGPLLEYMGNPGFQPTYNENLPTYTFYFSWDWIGMSQSPTNFFKFESLYASDGGSRYPESFESVTATGPTQWGTLNFSNYDVFGIDPVPETVNAALVAFGGLFVTVGVFSRFKRLREQGK